MFSCFQLIMTIEITISNRIIIMTPKNALILLIDFLKNALKNSKGSTEKLKIQNVRSSLKSRYWIE